MALHGVENKVHSLDGSLQRQGAGTLGGEHMVPGSIQGHRMTNVVDNTDPRVSYGYYGTGTASFTQQTTAPFARGGTTIWTQTANAAMQLKFTGTSIGILAPSNPTGDDSAEVYIDGQVAYGRIPVACGQGFPASSSVPLSTPSVSIYDDTVSVVDSSNFASSGYILIDDEVMSYSSIAYNIFQIDGRGEFDTQVTDHYYDATVYQWSNVVSFYESGGYSTQNTVFYNPFLSQGPHTVTLVCSGGGGNMYLDAFVIGSLIGSKSMNIQTGTAAVTVTTSANGHADIGALSAINSDVQVIGVIGYEQTTPTASIDNATTLAKLGVKNETSPTSAQSWQPIFYIHNGPASTTVTIRITFSYIGASI